MSSGTVNCSVGHCLLMYNSVPLGLTRGGSELEIRVHVTERCSDEHGIVPTTLYFAGATARLHTHLAEHTVHNLSQIIPGSQLLGGSVLTLGGAVGKEILGFPLVITPVDESDPIGQVTLFRAVPLPAGRIPYQPGKERIIPITFHGLVDQFLEDGERLMKWSASADQIPPQIISSIPDDGEIGVSTDTQIEIIFSEHVAALSPETLILLDESNDAVVSCSRAGERLSDSEFLVTVTPETSLEPLAVHRIIIAALADSSGNKMDVRVLKFTTEENQ